MSRRLVWMRLASLVLALAGAGVAIALVREHLTIFEGDVLRGPFCGGGGRFDCGKVAADPASWMLGLPVALWGLVVYLALAGLSGLTLLLRDAERAAAGAIAATLVTMALFVDAYLGWVMIAHIGAICLLCVTTYAINLALAALLWTAFLAEEDRRAWRALASAWRAPAGSEPAERRRRLGVLATGALSLAAIAVAFGLTARSVGTMRQEARDEAIDFVRSLADTAQVDMSRFAGLPARGPAGAKVQIAIASDFQCSWCRGMAVALDRLQREFPHDLRVTYVNSPVSTACDTSVHEDLHPSACWLAEVGYCAERQGKFWDYHDTLFERVPLAHVTHSEVAPLLSGMGLDTTRVRECLQSGEAEAAVARDVALCHALRLDSTPTLVINGHIKLGAAYPWALRAIVKAIVQPS